MVVQPYARRSGRVDARQRWASRASAAIAAAGRRPASRASRGGRRRRAMASSQGCASSGCTAGRPSNVARSSQRGPLMPTIREGWVAGAAVGHHHRASGRPARCPSGPHARWRCRRAGRRRRRSGGGPRSRGRRPRGAAKARSSIARPRRPASRTAPPRSARRPGAAARCPRSGPPAASRGRSGRRRPRRGCSRRPRDPGAPRPLPAAGRPRRRRRVGLDRTRSALLRRNISASPAIVAAHGHGDRGRSLR